MMVATLGPPAPRNTLLSSANLLAAVISIAGGIGLVMAVLAHFRWNDQKLWREVAEGRKEEVEDLGRRLRKAQDERELLSVEIEAIRGELSLLQRERQNDREEFDTRLEEMLRQNHRLQLRLDDAETHGKGLQVQADKADARSRRQHPEDTEP